MKIGNCKYKFFNVRRHMFAVIVAMLSFCTLFAGFATAQDNRFRIGEKLTYNVSFGKFTDAAYFETAVVSRGNLSGQEVVELRSRLRTREIVSAAFFQLDETRNVFVAPDTGLPVYISKNINYGVEPKETVDNFLKEPASSFDLVSLIYKARYSNGAGSFPLVENGQHYTVTFQPTISEKVKAEAGEFDTVVSLVQSDYLTAIGIKELKINFVADENHVPALIRIKTAKGIFTASVATIQIPKPMPVSTPELSKTSAPAVTPPAKATPTPYIENQPILPELGFILGETLDYNISEDGRRIGVISLAAKERKMFQNEDSLLLTATVTVVEQGNLLLSQGDSIQVQVDPDTLAPRWIESRFAGDLKWLNQTAFFDKRTGNISFGKERPVDSPIGTHTILSLMYAMRSFNLKPSKDASNPVNDTRVAVFWDSRPYVFTLIPSNPEEITVNGENISAQMIAFKTGSELLDKQGLKVWLAANERVPVRVSFGTYQADLIAPAKSLTK